MLHFRVKLAMVWAVVLITALGISVVQAQAPGCRGGAWSEDGPGWQLGRLDLTEEQRAEITKLRAEASEKRPEMHKRMLRLQHELRGQMLEDEPNVSKLRDLTREIGTLRTEMQLARLELRLAIRKLLTPEQRDRLLLHAGRDGDRGPRGHHGRQRDAGRGCGRTMGPEGRGPHGGAGMGMCHPGCGRMQGRGDRGMAPVPPDEEPAPGPSHQHHGWE